MFQKLENFKINIPNKRIYARLGYRVLTSKISDTVVNMVNEQRQSLSELLQPKAVFSILDYSETNRHPIFKDAEKVAICVCTIGSELENASSELIKQNEMLNGLILDTFGSEAVENVARQTDKILAGKAREMNLWPSKRFSPGFGIWDIREQKYIFQILTGDQIGVSLNDSCMMIPRKSVSFRINYFKDKSLSSRSLY